MKTIFAQLRQTRKNMLAFYEKNKEKAFVLPEGFENCLYWNLAHCVVTQQLLHYKLSGNEMLVDQEVVDKYRKGTIFDGNAPSFKEVDRIKDLALITVDQLEKDYEIGLFKNYNEYPTSFNITLMSIEDALSFNLIHEGLHLGYMMAMVK